MPRRRKPSALRAIDGGADHRPRNLDEPKPPVSATVPVCPDWIGEYGRALWDQQAPLHHRLGTLTEADHPAFAAMCEAWDTYRRAVVGLRDELTHVTPNNGVSAKPEASVRKQALADFSKLANEFGLTPAARARIKANPPDGHEDPVKSYQKARPQRPA